MNSTHIMIFYCRHYLTGVVIEAFVLSLLFLFLYIPFNLSPWCLLIPICIWGGVISDYSQKKSDVIMDNSGILIDNNNIKWDNISTISINSIFGSTALELKIIKKNGATHEMRFFPMPLFSNNIFVVDKKIRELSGHNVKIKLSFWIKHFDYPISKCIIFLFNKESKNT